MEKTNEKNDQYYDGKDKVMNMTESKLVDLNEKPDTNIDGFEEEKRVVIAVPTMGSIHPMLVSTLLRFSADANKKTKNLKLAFYFTHATSPVCRARNQIVKWFLEDRKNKGFKDFTHILFIDSDTIPPVDALKKLLLADKDVISGLTPILQQDPNTGEWGTIDNCFTKIEEMDDGSKKTYATVRNTGLQEIIKCGASCLLVKREVFEKLEKPYFKFIFNEDGSSTRQGEDLYFCTKVKEAGFEIWADTSVICKHSKTLML